MTTKENLMVIFISLPKIMINANFNKWYLAKSYGYGADRRS